MSKEFSFTHTARSKADPEVLYELVADGSRWSSWAGPLVPRSSWVRTGGDGDPLGVGAVRKLGMWPVLVQERTIAAEPGRLHRYTLETGAPIKDYIAEFSVAPQEGGGSTVTWTGRFTERVPGTGAVIRAGLGSFIGALLRRVVRAAESAR